MKSLIFILAILATVIPVHASAQESDYLPEAESHRLLQEDGQLLQGNACHFAERDNNLQLMQRCAAATKRNNEGCTAFTPCLIRRVVSTDTKVCKGSVCQSLDIQGTGINNSTIKANTIKTK